MPSRVSVFCSASGEASGAEMLGSARNAVTKQKCCGEAAIARTFVIVVTGLFSPTFAAEWV